MRTLTLVAALAASAFAGAALAAGDQGSDYIQDIARESPNIQRTWRWIVPRTFAGEGWIIDLTQGTSGPVERMVIDGKRFILGSSCWPHNCAENNVVFLIDADGKEAYGLLSSRDLKIPEVYFGHPDTAKTILLRQAMKPLMQETDTYYKNFAN